MKELNNITIVVPTSDKDLYRLECVLLSSLDLFFEKDSVYEVILVYMSSGLDRCVELQQRFTNLKIRLIEETEITNVKPQVRWRRRGWHYQQMLKLGVAKFVNTENYLLMDADCFAIKKVGCNDLIVGGKNLVTFKTYYGYMARWPRESSQLLKMPAGAFTMMGVTPQLIRVDVVRKLLEFLEKRYELKWDEILAHNKFTEYTLYWIYLCNEYDWSDFYVEGQLHSEKDCVFQSSADKLDVESVFDAPAYFSIVQSVRRGGLAKDDICKLRKYFEDKE